MGHDFAQTGTSACDYSNQSLNGEELSSDMFVVIV